MELSWLVSYAGTEDVLSFEGDDESFMGDVSSSLSRLPTCPMKVDIELFALDEGREHVEVLSFCVGSDEDDSIAGSKGVYGRSGKSTAGDVGVIRHVVSVPFEVVKVVVFVVGAIALPTEVAVLDCMKVGGMSANSRFEFMEFVCAPDFRVSEELLEELNG